MVSAVIVLIALIVIYFLLIPGMRPADRRFRTGLRPIAGLSDLARAGSADGAGDWVTTFIGLLAISALWASGNAINTSAGAAVGVVCGLLSISSGLSSIRDWILSAVGLVAAFYGVAELLNGREDSVSFMSTILMLIATGFAFAAGITFALIRFSLGANVGLQAFVTIELVTFLSAPLGVELLGANVWIAIGVSIFLGFLVGASPKAVFSMIGIGIGMVTLYGRSQGVSQSGLLVSEGAITVVVIGMVMFLISRALIRPLSTSV